MAFVNISLLAGTMLIGIPIIVHLAMRQRPKVLVFPALRFVKQQQRSNERRLQIRHWMLLLLRCLALGAMALALARPSVASTLAGDWGVIGVLTLLLAMALFLCVATIIQRRGILTISMMMAITAVLLAGWVAMFASTLRAGSDLFIGDREAPVAAILAFDTAPRMDYLHEAQTRLDTAKTTAGWLVRQLPLDSRVAVIQSRSGPSVFSADVGAARKSIERLKTTAAGRDLNALLENALQLTEQTELGRKEIYLFTDLARASWGASDPAALRQTLADKKEVLVYVIDVGVEEPRNLALGDLRLEREAIPKNAELTIGLDITRIGPATDCAVELFVEEVDKTRPLVRDGETLVPKSIRRSHKTVTLPTDGSQVLEFSVVGLEAGTRQGTIRIVGEDGLEVDNTRYFTVDVNPAWPVLVVAPSDTNTISFTEAIAPYQFARTERARFHPTVIPQSELSQQPLEDFAAICLLNPQPLEAALWQRLEAFVRRGGGLALFLGHHAVPRDSFNAASAQALMVGVLGAQFRAPRGQLVLAPHSYDHPIMSPFREVATSAPWDLFPVFMHWGFERISPDAQAVLRYGNNQPALLERSVGRGRVLVMTTPVTEPDRPEGRRPWNELAGPDDWPRFILMNSLMDYLVGSGADRLNYFVGQTAGLPNDPDKDPDQYQLFTPLDDTLTVRTINRQVIVKSTDDPGAYRLKGDRGGPIIRGFSVNLPAADSDLARATPEELDQQLGKDRYQYARGRDEITRVQGTVRAGREFYPFLVIALVFILGLEGLLANRFYRKHE